MAGQWSRAMLALLMIGTLRASGGVPAGHPDSFPDATRPWGWRGDGSGAWPGAEPVYDWNAETGRNIVWRIPMPGAAMAQPLVLGEKVFTVADPNLLICVDVHDGRIVWQRAVDHVDAMPADMAQQARSDIAVVEAYRTAYYNFRFEVDEFFSDLRANGIRSESFRSSGDTSKSPAHLVIPAPDAPGREDYERVMADPDLKTRFEALLKAVDEHGFLLSKFQHRSYANNEQIRNALKVYDLWLLDLWEGYTSWHFATPVTDGTYIYYTGPNNQVACYDLNGNRKWLIWEHEVDSNPEQADLGIGTRFVDSPLLVGDVLVVRQNGELRGYNKANGEKLWSHWNAYAKRTEGKPHRNVREARPEPEATSPVHMALPLPGGGVLDVVLDGGGNAYRVADGKIVGRGLPRTHRGPTALVQDDLYVHSVNTDGPDSIGVSRLAAKDVDTVELVETLWQHRDGAPEYTSVLYDGWIITKGLRWELMTGRQTGTKGGGGTSGPIVAGNALVSIMGYSARARAEKGAVGHHVYANIQQLDGRRQSGNGHNQPCFIDGRRAGDRDADHAFVSRYRFCNFNGSYHMQASGSPVAHANRLFWRSPGYLWCVGDPTQIFPPNRNAPESARLPESQGRQMFEAAMSAAQSATVQELVTMLESNMPAARMAACRELAAKGVAGLTAQPALRKVLANDAQPNIRAMAATAMLAADPALPIVEELLKAGDGDMWWNEPAWMARQTLLSMPPNVSGPRLAAVAAGNIPGNTEFFIELLREAGADARDVLPHVNRHLMPSLQRSRWDQAVSWVQIVGALDPAMLDQMQDNMVPLINARLQQLDRGGQAWEVRRWLADLKVCGRGHEEHIRSRLAEIAAKQQDATIKTQMEQWQLVP